MNRFSFLYSVVVSVALSGASVASAQTSYYPPSGICFNQSTNMGAYYNKVEWYGTSDAGLLTCGLPLQDNAASDSNDKILAWYDDYNSTATSAGAFQCHWQTNDVFDSSTSYGAVKYSCSTSGGCSSGSTSFTGQGYLDLGLITRSAYATVSIYCSLPAYGTAFSALRHVEYQKV